MKIAHISICLSVMFGGLLGDRVVAQAQPSSGGPAPSERTPTLPSQNPSSAEDDSSSEDDSILIDNPDSPWSQGVSAEDRRAATALLREGARLYMVPLYAKAAEQYTAALRKWKHPALYYNLALTQRNLGKESDALENLERALEYGEKGLGPKRFSEAQKQLAALKRLLGRLRVTCKIPGAEVTLDGVTIFIGPGKYEGWVKAKPHEITAKKAGYISEARRVTVASEQLQDVELKLLTLDEAADAGRRWAAWKPWAVVIGGVAIAAAGGGFHALASKDFNDYDDRFLQLDCVTSPDPQAPGCTEEQIGPDLNALLDRAKRRQVYAVSGYIAGGSLIASGIVLLYMNRPRLAKEATSSPARNVAVVPTVSADMLGISISVSH